MTRLLVPAPCFLVAVIALALAGCGSGTEQNASTYSGAAATAGLQSPALTPAPTPSEVISPGEPAYEIAKSLRTMVEELQTVVVGRVVGVEGQFYEYIPAPDGSEPLGGWPITISLVEVIKVIHASRVKEGQTIRVVQAGGTLPDGRTYVSSGVGRPPSIGTTYLFFLSDAQPVTGEDEFGTGALFRFVVENELIRPNGQDALPGIAAVSGVSQEEFLHAANSLDRDSALKALTRVTVEEAAAVIQAVIGRAPLPEPAPLESGTIRVYPSPKVTASP